MCCEAENRRAVLGRERLIVGEVVERVGTVAGRVVDRLESGVVEARGRCLPVGQEDGAVLTDGGRDGRIVGVVRLGDKRA